MDNAASDAQAGTGESDSAGGGEPPPPSAGTSATGLCHVEIALAAPMSTADRDWLADHAERATKSLDATGECRVRIVGDAEMARLHGEHLDDPTTTDVLTFDLSGGGSIRTRELDVDLVLCLDAATRQAGELGHEPRRELLLYLVHGLLHCLGHDDTDEQSFERMHAEEDRVLIDIGVGATFDPERAS